MIKVLPESELRVLSLLAEAHGLALSDIASTCQVFNVPPQDVLNELSVTIAEGYLQESLTYEFCSGVMNGIINAVIEVGMNRDIPQPAFALYQAFDQGEWLRSHDPEEADPSEKYTKPIVLEVMRALKVVV